MRPPPIYENPTRPYSKYADFGQWVGCILLGELLDTFYEAETFKRLDSYDFGTCQFSCEFILHLGIRCTFSGVWKLDRTERIREVYTLGKP